MRTILRSAITVVCIALLFATSVRSQLAPAGTSGVVMGHLHLTTKDAAASRSFWAALGGSAVQNGTLQLIQFPGTFVMLRQGAPTGGTSGSTVDHVTFLVKDVRAAIDRLLKEPGVVASRDITTADGIDIRLVGDSSVDGGAQLGSISIVTISPEDTRAWYMKHFGMTVGTRGAPTAVLPGVILEFSKAATAPAGTRGRALDHIGFEVKGLEEFCKKLEAAGIKLDRPFTRLPNSSTAIAFLTDPWGTYIELTENLAPPK